MSKGSERRETRPLMERVTTNLDGVARWPVTFLAAHGVASGMERGEAIAKAEQIIARHRSDALTIDTALALMREMAAS